MIQSLTTIYLTLSKILKRVLKILKEVSKALLKWLIYQVSASANVSFPSVRWSRVTTSRLDSENFQPTLNVSEVFGLFGQSKPKTNTCIPFVCVQVSGVLPVFPQKGPSVRSFPVATACQPRQSGQPMVGSLSLALFISLVVHGKRARPRLATGGKGEALSSCRISSQVNTHT